MGTGGTHLDIASELAPLEADWRRLADESDNVFATWEWLSAWWQHFGIQRPLRIVAIRADDGTAQALLPLYVAARVPVRVARFLGHGPTDQLGPVCAVADRKLAADALSECFERGIAGDLLVADELPGGTPWSMQGAITLGRSPSPVASLVEGDLPRNSRLRAQVRRKERRLRELGRVSYRQTAALDQLQTDLSVFLALHDARWKPHGGSRSFAKREAFHRDFAARALARGWLRLRFIELDGSPIAALYNLSYAGAESNYQAGRDPRFSEFSVGLALHAHAMRDAAAAHDTEYRFLRGGESYKERFADADACLESVAFARGLVARAATRALRPVPQLPRPVRRRVPAPFAWGTGSSPVWSRP
jgi:CelD/BcsL family acetyltransferase involved in cellulose biosynthesis